MGEDSTLRGAGGGCSDARRSRLHDRWPRDNPRGALIPSDTQDSGGNDFGKNILRCQLEEATMDTGGGTKQGQLVDDVFQEARERSVVPEQVFSERGYDCGWSALQKSGGRG